jgi:aryl-alcohol dehydrogenase-like predicted oxidoreductase
MQTVDLGNTGIRVSKLCLGAMYFGTSTDEPTSYQLLDQYLDAGGSFIDTANIYAHWVKGFRGGESELLLGRWMQQRKNRAGVFLASKVGFEYPGITRGLSPRQVEEECEKSLRKLGTDHIDLFYAHVDDRSTPMEETLAAFDRLVRSGKVRFIGASNFRAWRLEEALWVSQAHGYTSYVCIQQRHTYLRPRAGQSFDPQVSGNDDLLDYCRAHPVTLLAYAALLAGAYTRPERSFPGQYSGEAANARLAVLHAVAAEKGISSNQLILAWMLHSDPFVLPLIAASNSQQLRENISALDVQLTTEEMERLNQA